MSSPLTDEALVRLESTARKRKTRLYKTFSAGTDDVIALCAEVRRLRLMVDQLQSVVDVHEENAFRSRDDSECPKHGTTRASNCPDCDSYGAEP